MNINPKEIKYYKIVTADSADELQSMVNNNIEAGFVPIGGVAVVMDSYSWENERKGYTETEHETMFTQAMVSLHDV